MTIADSELVREARLSLSTRAARTLATTTKSEPQMRAISPRWLLRVLPWVDVQGGVYRVNCRRTYTESGRVRFAGGDVIPVALTELPPLRGFTDEDVLTALAGRFERQEFLPGDVLMERGRPVDRMFLLVHGKVSTIGVGPYGEPLASGVLADGDHFGHEACGGGPDSAPLTIMALTPVIALALSRRAFDNLLETSEELRAHLARPRRTAPRNRKGEADIAVASGHTGEPGLPGAFVDYASSPREYELSVAQTVLRVHSRVADLFNEPMDQVEQQLRLTVAAVRERQEHELVNNRDFGLLHNVADAQRIQSRSGPPTPDDLDNLLSRMRKPQFILAHPRTIAAFGRECNRRGLRLSFVELDGARTSSWRGVPLLPCDKFPVSGEGTSSVMMLRTGEENRGVIGLRQTRIRDEHEPGLSVRRMGIDGKGVVSYLVSAYYSVAVLVPNAMAVLDNVEIAR